MSIDFNFKTERNMLSFRATNRTFWVLVYVVTCIAMHVAAFYAMRKPIVITFGDPDQRVRAFYFSKKAKTNQTLYVIFYPMIRLTGGYPEGVLHYRDSPKFRDVQEIRNVYLFNPSPLGGPDADL